MKTVGEMKCFSYSFTYLLVFVIKIRFPSTGYRLPLKVKHNKIFSSTGKKKGTKGKSQSQSLCLIPTLLCTCLQSTNQVRVPLKNKDIIKDFQF